MNQGITAAPFGVRLAGLPASVIRELRTEKTHAAANEILKLRKLVEHETDDVIALVYDLVSGLCEGDKPHFIRLKRALRRDSAVGPLATSLKPRLPGALRDRIATLDDLRCKLKRDTKALLNVLSEERQRRTVGLREISANPQFLHGLASASPNLLLRLRPWLTGSRTSPRRRDVNTLAQFVVRCAAKTSPRSTFTAVGLGGWRSEPNPAPQRIAHKEGVLATELNAAVYRQIADHLASDNRLRDLVDIRINPTAVPKGNRLWWTPAGIGKPLMSVGLGSAVRACFEIGGRGKPSAADFRQAVMASVKSCLPEEADEFVGELILVGLLEPLLPIPDQAEDALESVLEWVSSSIPRVEEPTHLKSIRTDLERAHTQLSEFCLTTGVDELIRLNDGIAQAIGDARMRLGTDERSSGSISSSIVFHDSLVLPDPVRLSTGRFEAISSDLETVRRALAVFDPKLPFRVGLTAYFEDWFGAGATVPFMDFVRKYYQDGPLGPADSGLEALRLILTPEQEQKAFASVSHTIRRAIQDCTEFRKRLVADISSIEADVAGTIRIPNDLILSHLGSWPETIRPPKSIAVYAQVSAGCDGLIVNSIDTGYGRGLARTRKLLPFDPLQGHYVEYIARQAPILAELDALFSNSVNARRPSVRFSIDCAGSVSGRAHSQLLRLHDFQVVHKARDSRLILLDTRLHREVQPVHTGLMWDAFLPPVIRLLMDTFAEPATYVHPNSWWLNTDFNLEEKEVRYYPRIDLGAVTLRRAFWTAYGGEIPRLRKGEPDDAYFLRILEWIRNKALPERSFVRVFDRQAGRLRKDRKPMLLDTTNWFLVDAFRRRAISGDDLVVFTEELPEIDARSNSDLELDRIVEYVFETSDGDLGRTKLVD
jgi:hypothetical protein